ncbi:ABC transporter permease [Bauldia litoralis]|uniref:Autoinducer 2 import system permease protein LsrC n=1 Tax=Bauldia litoralis TaxID=665467 RepID=A0A1G6DYB2_9HYPH|nr:ABC transporter permease [Bauldia litoralis]SDB50177.1 simple sugar transport system permease protein [Bauldia litoralis]
MTDIADKHDQYPQRGALHRLVLDNRAALGTFVVFVLMMALFFWGNPQVFSDWRIYNSVLTTLPVALFLVVPLVFIVTVGEIDLSFPAVMGSAAWIFALGVAAGYDPFLCIAVAIVVGMVLGIGIGAIVVYAGLSSLVATLGMNYLLRGAILIFTNGKSIAVVSLKGTVAYDVLSGSLWGFPVQMLWATAFIILSMILYNRHKFGARVHCVGDNPDSAEQMGIDTKRIRVYTFVFMGFGAALAGIFSTMINFTWWPTSGDSYLLPTLAAVFLGGTPTWGGIGTILGGAIGAVIVSFIQVGIVSAGLDGFYVQFFNGLIIILALLGHRWNQTRYR